MLARESGGVRPECVCGAPATSGSSRQECPRCFRARLLSVSLDPSLGGRTSATYYDQGGVDEAFGPDAQERLLEGTEGRGYARTDDQGRVWARNPRTRDPELVDERTFDRVYAGSDSEREATPEEMSW